MIKGKQTKNMFLEYETNIENFKNHVVKIGLPEKVGGNSHTDSGLTVAQLGAVHEFGVPEKGIWKRSFLREPIINEQKQIKSFIKLKFSQVTANSTSASRALEEMGLFGMRISQKSFSKNNWHKLSDAREAQKVKNGKSKNNPLRDTGQLFQSITYAVEKL